MEHKNTEKIRQSAIALFTVALLAAVMAPTVYAGTTGTATFGIGQTVSLTVPTASINFGSGSPAAGSGTTIASNSVNTGGWTSNPGGFVVENDGNVNIKVQLYAEKTAALFIGGTGPTYDFQSSNNEDTACTSGLQTAWEAVPLSAAPKTVCSVLGFADSGDTIKVDLQLHIPADAPVASHSDTVTFTAQLA